MDYYLNGLCFSLLDVPLMIAGFFFGTTACIVAAAVTILFRMSTLLFGADLSNCLICCLALALVCGYTLLIRIISLDKKAPGAIVGFIVASFGKELHFVTYLFFMYQNPEKCCEAISETAISMIFWCGFTVAVVMYILNYDNTHRFLSFQKVPMPYFLFGAIIVFLAAMSIYVIDAYSGELLKDGQDSFQEKMSNLIALSAYQSTSKILKNLEEGNDTSSKNLKRMANVQFVDEASCFDLNGKILTSSSENVLACATIMLALQEEIAYAKMPPDKRPPVYQSFRASRIPPFERSCFTVIPFSDKTKFLKTRYSLNTFLQEFEKFFLPEIDHVNFSLGGYYMVVNEDGVICNKGTAAHDMFLKHIQDLGIRNDFLQQSRGVQFKEKINGVICLCSFICQYGQWRVYAIFPEAELYTKVFVCFSIVALLFLALCLLFNWITLRSSRGQKIIDELNFQKEVRVKRDLLLAHNIQDSELRKDEPDNKYYKISATMISAREIGGDFYDYYTLQNGCTFIGIADVSGKGIPAAFFMMKAKTALKLSAYRGQSIREISEISNNEIIENNNAQMFVTFWGAFYDPDTRCLEYVSAGHNPPLIRRANGSVEWVSGCQELPLGVRKRVSYTPQKLQMEPGDRILLYTDGVTEAKNSQNHLFGNQRLFDVLKNMRANHEIISSVLNAVRAFSGDVEQADDITMLVLTVK